MLSTGKMKQRHDMMCFCATADSYNGVAAMQIKKRFTSFLL